MKQENNRIGITSLRLFGSVARNQHHDGSDVDIYVEMPPKFFLIVRLKAYLEELLDSPVDIIRKHQHLNPFLLKEIEKDGIEVIANRNERQETRLVPQGLCSGTLYSSSSLRLLCHL